jgi:uncharacterized membrane protein YbhN (UPF0104 family)
VKKLLRLCVSGAILTWLALRLDWTQIGESFAHMHFGYWMAALLLYVATQIASALRWRMLAEPLGFNRPLGHYSSFYFIGMYFNLFLPSSVGGDVIRAMYLNGGSGRRLSAFLSVFLDRFSGLLVLLCLACIGVGLCPVPIPNWVPWSVWGTGLAALVGLLLLPTLAKLMSKFDRVHRLVSGVRLYLDKPGILLSTTGLSLAVQAANVALVWLVGKSINAGVPASYYWVVVPMVTLLTLLPVTLNGMGVREGGMILFLAPLGVPEATAVSMGVLWFLVFTAASVLGGGIYLFGNFPRPEERTNEFVGSDSDQGRAGQLKAAA